MRDKPVENRAQRLNYAIRRRSVTKMAALAYEIDVDESAISRWRRGGPMSLANAEQLCLFLDISMDWLFLNRGGISAHHDFHVSLDERELIMALRGLSPASVEVLSKVLAIVTRCSAVEVPV